jgi:hypothetical protein
MAACEIRICDRAPTQKSVNQILSSNVVQSEEAPHDYIAIKGSQDLRPMGRWHRRQVNMSHYDEPHRLVSTAPLHGNQLDREA